MERYLLVIASRIAIIIGEELLDKVYRDNEKKLKMKKKNDPITEEKQCIICGTLIDDLDPEDVVKIKQGYLCKGCLAEKWFVKCDRCDEYDFESNIYYIEEEDSYLCKSCYQKRGKDV